MLDAANEVPLDLLSLQESVELVSAIACLDDVPPVLLEIAQLAGRE